MLRQIYIIKDNDILYERIYGKALDNSLFMSILPKITKEAFSPFGREIGEFDFFKYKISYIIERDLNIIFIFVTGLTDDFNNIKIELNKLKKEFLKFFSDNINDVSRLSIDEVINPFLDEIHRNLRPKISLVGFSGVGKTTITKLIKAEEIPMKHIPTINGDVATIKIGKLHIFIWDFAGQERFNFLWNKFIKQSDAVLLISDSTTPNIERNKFFLELIDEEAPHAHSAIICNKQDLPDAISPEIIERLMGLKTYSMIATDPENKNKMIKIIADILDMDPEVSPLLKPLFEREKLINKAEKALESGDYEQAMLFFEEIGDLSVELGDDSLGNEYKEKSKNLKNIISSNSSNISSVA